MLTAIASLAEKEEGSRNLTSLVEKVASKDCLLLIFEKYGQHKFLRCELSANNGEDKYLYHKEPSGKPGLFLSWTIPAQGEGSIRQFQELTKKEAKTRTDEEKLQDFWEKKFAWFSKIDNKLVITKNKLLNDDQLLGTLDNDSRSLLSALCHSFATSFSQIKKVVQSQLLDYEFSKEKGIRNNKLLVSIAFENKGTIEYPADIPSFVDLFSRAVSGTISSGGNIVCTICNSSLAGELRPPYPVEFLTQDQLVYLPAGDPAKKADAFALCQRCSDRLRSGQAFINAHLSYRIVKSRLFFWLVPIFPDNKIGMNYLRELDGDAKPLYLSQLRSMCEGLDTAATASYDAQSNVESESWLTFTSVFCYKDSQGHTRIAGVAEGIYPSRLRELSNCSQTVQKRYPYFLINPKVMFSFPLLSRFFEGERGDSSLVSIMEALFTESSVNERYITSEIAERIRSAGLTRAQRKHSMPVSSLMKSFVGMTFDALIIMEYLVETCVLEKKGEMYVSMINDSLKDNSTEALMKFINSHKLVNQNDTIRSIFLTGVAVGILLEVQMKEFKSYPFWKHLNRLELDLDRVKTFYPDVKARLIQYRTGAAENQIKALRNLIEYIGANLDFDHGSEIENMDRDLIDLVFSIGLSEGYLIFHGIGV